MEPFKNHIHEALAIGLGDLVRKVDPDFSTRAYRAKIRGNLEPLELKARAILVGEGLWEGLSGTGAARFRVLTKAVQQVPVIKLDGLQSGWHMFPMDMILTAHGAKAKAPALRFAREVTQRFTAEFGIRTLIEDDLEWTLGKLASWTGAKSPHVRRLVSEGTRPRLPWGQQLKELIVDPRPTRPLLEALKDDPEEYVRRSVANHWNDIAKDHPEYVVDAMEKWSLDADANRQRLIRHACRSLIKAGHPRCLELLGFGPPKLAEASLRLKGKKLVLGETLECETRLKAKRGTPQDLILDYRFHFVKASGRTSPKVFKGKQVRLESAGNQTVPQRFPLKRVTTRKYYPGKTRVELLVNGVAVAEASFDLVVPADKS